MHRASTATAQTGHRHRAEQCQQIYAALPQAAVSDLAHLPGEPCPAAGGDDFREHVRDMGICEVLSAPRAPWQRAYIERVIGSVRRECLDHMIVLHETSLRRTLTSYFDYYHRWRTHLSLGKDAPEPRAIHPPEMGSVVALVRRVLAHVRITATLVHQIQAGSTSPSTFAVRLEEYLRPLGCSEFPGGTDYIA